MPNRQLKLSKCKGDGLRNSRVTNKKLINCKENYRQFKENDLLFI